MTDHFLHHYFLNNAGKRIHKWVHYFDIYERHFERYRGRSPRVLEIGVAGGGSLQMWSQYFGPGSQIIGLDINEACREHAAPGVDVVIGSQSDEKVLASIVEKYGALDIVIDDGSHRSHDLIATFEYLYPRISERGVYLAEDTYMSYRRTGPKKGAMPGSFIEYMKVKVDELYAIRDNGMPVTTLTRGTQFICFYDSVVVAERAPQGARQAPRTAAMQTEAVPLDEVRAKRGAVAARQADPDE